MIKTGRKKKTPSPSLPCNNQMQDFCSHPSAPKGTSSQTLQNLLQLVLRWRLTWLPPRNYNPQRRKQETGIPGPCWIIWTIGHCCDAALECSPGTPTSARCLASCCFFPILFHADSTTNQSNNKAANGGSLDLSAGQNGLPAPNEHHQLWCINKATLLCLPPTPESHHVQSRNWPPQV